MQQNQQSTSTKLLQSIYPDAICKKRVFQNYVKFKRNAVEMRNIFTTGARLGNPKNFQNSYFLLQAFPWGKQYQIAQNKDEKIKSNVLQNLRYLSDCLI